TWSRCERTGLDCDLVQPRIGGGGCLRRVLLVNSSGSRRRPGRNRGGNHQHGRERGRFAGAGCYALGEQAFSLATRNRLGWPRVPVGRPVLVLDRSEATHTDLGRLALTSRLRQWSPQRSFFTVYRGVRPVVVMRH